MAVTAHPYPTFDLNGFKKTVNATTDTLRVLLITSGTYTWNSTSQGHTTVNDFLAGSGAGATLEVTGGSYTRLSLGSVTLTNSGQVTTLTCASPSWSSVSLTASYAVFFDNTVGGTDSTNQLICYWDFGSAQTVAATAFTLNVNASGLVTWTTS